MAIFKCKMCGGDLNITELDKVVECEYCGTTQTVPSADNEKKMTLFNRANKLRLNSEFDKAYGVYEQIVAEFPDEAEAYWGLCLCHYGIEYVDDPATGKKIPTCHRSSFDSVMEDENFEQACENADVIARRVYRDEAKRIEEIRKGIIEVSAKEEPYDIFICYKETDEAGGRTVDSAIAQDVYDALTEKGYRVFFSRISLEDKLGQEYEPYIFAALNSAKIMLAFGTDYEYFNAVWVKNEWSRFLQLIAAGQKKTLIPCYKDIDAYDMPKEFAKLQAQDMGKVGAIQDLLRGIDKILPKNNTGKSAQPAVQPAGGANVAALLQRGNMALEDKEYKNAQEYFDRVLDEDPQNAEAYLGLAMAEAECFVRDDFEKAYVQPDKDWDNDKNVKRVRQFADGALKSWLEQLDDTLKANREQERIAAEAKRKELALARERIRPYQEMIAAGAGHTVGLKVDGTVVTEGSNYYGECDVSDWRDIVAIAGGEVHTVGLKSDGTVVAVGYNDVGQCNVSNWRDIVAVAAGGGDTSASHTVGLKSDGTVIAMGENKYGQCDVSDWRDIVAVAAGDGLTVGLKSDGTVVAVGKNLNGQCDVSDWRDVVAIAVESHTVGLKSDGTVVAVGNNGDGQCDVSNWRDVVAIAVGMWHTVGLKSDGTVVAVGYNKDGRCNVSDWRDVVAIAVGYLHTVGLKSDGTVVAVGDNEDGECDVSDWRDVVAIAVGDVQTIDQNDGQTVGLKSDGTVLAVGGNKYGQCDVSGWKLFKSPAEKETDYAAACAAQEIGIEEKLAEAAGLFNGIKEYKDSAERAQQCSRAYEEAKTNRESEKHKKIQAARERILPYQGVIAAGYESTVGVKENGMVMAVGRNDEGQCDVFDWRDIVSVTQGDCFTVGLNTNGIVVAVGAAGDVSDWRDIVAIAADEYTLGLKSDGTVVTTGDTEDDLCTVSNWRDIVAIAAGWYHPIGLKSDGTVVTDYDAYDDWHYIDWSDWQDIVAASASEDLKVGLKSDGTVVAVGNNEDGQCNVSDWRDIVAIAAGAYHTVGLKSDGTVVAVGNNEDVQCSVSDWRDIVAIAAGYSHTVGLKSDGTVVAVGNNDKGQCDVSGWKLFKSPAEKEVDYAAACAAQEIGTEEKMAEAAVLFKSLKGYQDSAERAQQCLQAYENAKATRESKEREARRAALTAEKEKLLAELPNIKGLFSGGKRKEVETRIAQIDAELSRQ